MNLDHRTTRVSVAVLLCAGLSVLSRPAAADDDGGPGLEAGAADASALEDATDGALADAAELDAANADASDSGALVEDAGEDAAALEDGGPVTEDGGASDGAMLDAGDAAAPLVTGVARTFPRGTGDDSYGCSCHAAGAPGGASAPAGGALASMLALLWLTRRKAR
jgi:MYXO-CTERM domain-containing protein